MEEFGTVHVSDRASTLAIKHRAKLDALFKGRHYTVIKPYDAGEGKRAFTALGNQCRHGFILRDDETQERILIGIKVLKQAASEYGAVTVPTVQKNPEEKQSLSSKIIGS